MKAVRGISQGVEVVDVDEPDGPGELIKVASVSICASDLRYLRRGSEQIQGHEIAGTTSDGAPVIVEAVFGCDACEWCAQGSYNMCRLAGVDILGMTVAGGMSEYFRAPSRIVVPVPTGLSLDDASLIEPGAVAWHACRKANVNANTRVAVVGAGAIGILAVLAARTMGSTDVAVEARHRYQMELGERFGATPPAGLYDVVIEASGTESGLARAVELTRPQGTVATVSVFPPEVRWPYRDAFLKEVQITPSMSYCTDGDKRETQRVADMLVANPDAAKALITHRFGIDDAARAFEVAATRPPGTFKVVVHP